MHGVVFPPLPVGCMVWFFLLYRLDAWWCGFSFTYTAQWQRDWLSLSLMLLSPNVFRTNQPNDCKYMMLNKDLHSRNLDKHRQNTQLSLSRLKLSSKHFTHNQN